jgi:sulfide dehydrogenase [flavocytochrome c] flavoprotein subunit
VVIGGGYGGATAARYLKLINPALDVVLVEKRDAFVSCPISNWVIAGLKDMQDITLGYDGLAARGIRIVKDEIIGIDAKAGFVQGKLNRLGYDRLIVSPGISFRYGLVDGLNEAAHATLPHAWHAGPQTQQLHNELRAMKPGENVVMTVPEGYYRCPPGPYERASLIADFLKKHKPGSKLILLDPHKDIASKGKLFHAAWDDYYQGIIDYRPETIIAAVDPGKKTVSSFDETFLGTVVNVIPEQRAGKLAFDFGLVPDKADWAPVDPVTLESTLVPGVHVIGDATDPKTSGPMPKSGFVASTMGKVAAAAVSDLLAGKQVAMPSFANTCYSMVNASEAIYVTGVYKYDPATGQNIAIKEASATSQGRSALYGRHAEDWAASIWSDILG